MTIYYELDTETKLTEEQENMLRKMEKHPAKFEEDCPELTDEELKHFYRISEKRREATGGKKEPLCL